MLVSESLTLLRVDKFWFSTIDDDDDDDDDDDG